MTDIREPVNVHVSMPKWNKGVAIVLSLFVPGLGQLYKGQIINGLFWFLIVLVGYIAFVIPGLVLHFLCLIGASMGNPYK